MKRHFACLCGNRTRVSLVPNPQDIAMSACTVTRQPRTLSEFERRLVRKLLGEHRAGWRNTSS